MFVQYTIHCDKTQMLKIFPLDKLNVAKNALSFLLRAPTHRSFTFILRFLFELKDKVRLSKSVCGIFNFQFLFVKVYIFPKHEALTLLPYFHHTASLSFRSNFHIG